MPELHEMHPVPEGPPKSGWQLFVRMKGAGWLKCDPSSEVFTEARAMYDEAVRDSACESAALVRIQTIAGFDRGMSA